MPHDIRIRAFLRRSSVAIAVAAVIIGGITYGPVCNGQIATYAVKDQFWVFFLDPAHDVSVRDPSLGLDGCCDRSSSRTVSSGCFRAMSASGSATNGRAASAPWP
ncbi:MAG: fatty acid cis/trans isomerase [Thiocapsa sp.]|uniref:fatty acid cis/trans isomerase n=1 Tax=Thiocapsa sp. TaxID=2024551 RepID=UPI001BD0161C|nr:fatty acid cis/trans isomerase [Thiocapsa sp.]QVL49204.1 MAG: fatty acid cis/trans isomerase [Thiocapsa sp.]